MQIVSPRTITVIGEAQSQQANQVATFGAGVMAVNDNKEQAISEVNQKTEAIIKAIKEFGIKTEDIKTQNLSVYQREETYYEGSWQKTKLGQWSVNNSIEIKLRDVSRASELAGVLTRSGANNIWGPNFTIEEDQAQENSLLGEAIKDATKKATVIAQQSGGKLGKIISVSPSSQPSNIYRPAMEGGGGGASPLEPGSTSISEAVTVVFELE
jgi:uncharacterized protein YggE